MNLPVLLPFDLSHPAVAGKPQYGSSRIVSAYEGVFPHHRRQTDQQMRRDEVNPTRHPRSAQREANGDSHDRRMAVLSLRTGVDDAREAVRLALTTLRAVGTSRTADSWCRR